MGRCVQVVTWSPIREFADWGRPHAEQSRNEVRSESGASWIMSVGIRNPCRGARGRMCARRVDCQPSAAGVVHSRCGFVRAAIESFFVGGEEPGTPNRRRTVRCGRPR